MENNKKYGIRIGQYFKKHKFAVGIYMLLTLIASAMSVFVAFYMADMLNYLTLQEYEKCINAVLKVIIMYTISYLLYGYLGQLYNYKIAKPIAEEIQKDVSGKLFRYTSSVYASSNVGVLSWRAMNEPYRFVDNLDYIFNQIIYVLQAIVIVGYMCFLNIWLAVGIVAGVGMALVIRFYFLKKENKYENAFKDANESLQSKLAEVIRSEHDIKALNIDNEIKKDADEKIIMTRKTWAKFSTFQTWIGNGFEVVRICLVFGVSLLALFLAKEHLIEIAFLTYVIANKDKLSAFMYAAFRTTNYIRSFRNSQKRVNMLLNEDVYKVEKFGTEEIENFTGEIEFKNVSFKYKDINLDNGEEKIGNDVLKDISFKIEPNTTVAFVGKSGSGKTTILGLIDKLQECDDGTVYLCGKDIKTLSKDAIRNNISMVNQFPYIFDATVKENLLYVKPDATDEELNDVCKRSDLQEVIDELPNGIDTRVGESGVKLSGGQRQRLAIARALLKNTSIILLDESTSSLDNFAQANIQKSLESIKGGKTIVIVAHRLSTIKSADKIYFIKDGEIKNSGTFDDLFKNDEEFKKLFLIEVI